MFCGALASLVVLLGFVLLPTLHLGLVADDFFLLAPDQKLPLTQSADELHRPLRNVTLRVLESRLGIVQVLPYRVLVGASFAAALALLFLLAGRLGANRMGALAAVFVAAFFPKNHEVLYWFAAWQDLAAADALLLACLFFLEFRQSGRRYALAVAAAAYCIALGFKETTVVLPALLATIDLYRERSIWSFWRPAFWKAYVPFACILLLYVVYFFSQSGAASLAGAKTGGYYGFHGIAGVFAGVVRTVINIALPYATSLGLKDIRSWHVAALLAEAAIALFLVWRFRLWFALLLAAGWLICTILPTATFAAAFNADRYLFVPMLGVAMFIGLAVSAMLLSPGRSRYPLIAGVALALYTLAGVYHLLQDRALWRKAGAEVAMVTRDTMRQCSALPAGSELDVANLTHSLHPHGEVFANGFSEALHADGLPASVRIVRNFSALDSEQQALLVALQRCMDTPPESVSRRIILVEHAGRMERLNASCASTLVDADRARRPRAWDVLYPRERP